MLVQAIRHATAAA